MTDQLAGNSSEELALFPLDTVVFPGGVLQLRIFEPRYHELVIACLRQKEGFGICLSGRNKEHKQQAKELADNSMQFHSVGTLVKIVDFDRTDDGLLGITVCAERRFRVKSVDTRPNKLLAAKVEWMEEIEKNITEGYRNFSDLLHEIANHFELNFNDKGEKNYGEAMWVSGRLAELLPFELNAKQHLLEIDNPLSRLDYMQVLLEAIEAKRLPLT
ncbi:MAG: LON peptidase substrate-binding domain-containing protein [Candidatus Eutrophobiaceae bacterium]